jgi:hypothetical protein
VNRRFDIWRSGYGRSPDQNVAGGSRGEGEKGHDGRQASDLVVDDDLQPACSWTMLVPLGYRRERCGGRVGGDRSGEAHPHLICSTS